MYVKDLKPGMMLSIQEGYKCYTQVSRKSSLKRLRIAPSFLCLHFIEKKDLSTNSCIMYLGRSSEHINTKYSSNKNIRTVMVDGNIAYIESIDFKYLEPIFS